VTGIVPRWEWRTFGEGVRAAEPAFAGLTPDQVVESTEQYVLGAADADVVKVRADLMDVKHLRQVDDDGLEQWTPVMKAGFPLSAGDLTSVLTSLRVGAALTRPAYSLSELLAEVARPHPELLTVEVHKRRQRYRLHGCMAELTDVRTDYGTTRTVALESEDAGLVVAALRENGLDLLPNVSYPRALKVLARFGSEPCAVIDVGTNSVKFHIGERGPDGAWRTAVDRAEITRLGDGLKESGHLSDQPMARTADAIAGMVAEAKEQRVAGLAAVGTAGLRIAPNGADFVDLVRSRCGVTVEVISGEEEARLAYLAATSGLGLGPEGTRVVFDTGGGSSQFTFGEGDRVDERFSLEVGAVRFTEEFGLDGPVSDDVLAAAIAAFERDLSRLGGRAVPDLLVGMGGGLTNLAAVRHGLATYDPDVVQGTVLDRAEIDRQVELYRTRTSDARREVVGLQPQRAEIILAGALVVRTVMHLLGKDALTVSDRGLRYGVLAERYG
jgi:exopolyphosphatase / guanosine-5'-triphosphate,3'-diphosphate pyrophosphatase